MAQMLALSSLCTKHRQCFLKGDCEAQFIPLREMPLCFLDTGCHRSKIFPGIRHCGDIFIRNVGLARCSLLVSLVSVTKNTLFSGPICAALFH